MTRTSRLATIFSIGSAMALTSLAHAQAPAMPPGPPGPPGMAPGPGMPGPGGPGVAGGSGGSNVNSADSMPAFTDTMGTETTIEESIETESLPDTGGEPLLMVLGGMALACSAFAVRRKLA